MESSPAPLRMRLQAIYLMCNSKNGISTPPAKTAWIPGSKYGIYGCYVYVSEAHRHRYAAEFDFRYNNRIALGICDLEWADRALKGAKEKRLTYRTAHRKVTT